MREEEGERRAEKEEEIEGERWAEKEEGIGRE